MLWEFNFECRFLYFHSQSVKCVFLFTTKDTKSKKIIRKLHLHWTLKLTLFDVLDPAAFDTVHWYAVAWLLFIESNPRTAELDTTLPDDVVHLYCGAGLDATEQLMYFGDVSFTVILLVAFNVGVSISETRH